MQQLILLEQYLIQGFLLMINLLDLVMSLFNDGLDSGLLIDHVREAFSDKLRLVVNLLVNLVHVCLRVLFHFIVFELLLNLWDVHDFSVSFVSLTKFLNL